MMQPRFRSSAGLLALTLAALLLVCAVSESALARGSRGGHSGSRHTHHGHRLAIGAIIAAPAFWLFPPPVFAAPAAAAPPVYIEQGQAQPAPAQAAGEWWYYCADSKAYYPYVKECAGAWQPVAAEPRTGQ